MAAFSRESNWMLIDSLIWLVVAFSSLLDLSIETNRNKESELLFLLNKAIISSKWRRKNFFTYIIANFNWIFSVVQDLRKKMSQKTRATLTSAWCVTLAILLGIMEYLSVAIIRIGYFWPDAVNYARIQWALMVPSHLSLLSTILIVLKVSCILIEKYVVFRGYLIK